MKKIKIITVIISNYRFEKYLIDFQKFLTYPQSANLSYTFELYINKNVTTIDYFNMFSFIILVSS
jgi:hypothetical protein